MSKLQMSAESLRIQEKIKGSSFILLHAEGLGTDKLPIRGELNDLLDALKGDIEVKKLWVCISSFYIEKQIFLLMDFLESHSCLFANIDLFSDLQNGENTCISRIFKSLKDNNNIKEISINDFSVKDEQLLVLLESFSQKPNLKKLDLVGTGIELEAKLIEGFNEFFKTNKLRRFSIGNKTIEQEHLIKLLKIIKEKNSVDNLKIDKVMDDTGIEAICSLIFENSKIKRLTFPLGKLSEESKNKLLNSIQNNKTIIKCKIEWYVKGVISESSEEIIAVNELNIEIDKLLERNKGVIKEIAQVLKDFYKTPENLHKSTIHNYLKLYQRTDKSYLKKILGKNDIKPIIQNADKYIDEHFFEMVGIAQQPQFGNIILSNELLGHIVSYLEFSDINI